MICVEGDKKNGTTEAIMSCRGASIYACKGEAQHSNHQKKDHLSATPDQTNRIT
jgi:hypothetical protein